MNIIYIGQQSYSYQIERRQRKTIGIVIDHQDYFRILAPKHVNEDRIRDAILTKADWIVFKMKQFKDAESIRTPKNYREGDLFYYFGKPVHLKMTHHHDQVTPSVEVQNNHLVVTARSHDPGKTKAAVESFYRTATLNFLEQWISRYEKALDVRVNRVLVKAQKRRWGSCSSLNNLNFNYKCAMLPEIVFQYIIIHEMAHLVHLNHSKDFWHLVKAMCPDYKVIQQWLKTNSPAFDM